MKKIIFLSIVLSSHWAFAGNQVLTYGPSTIELTGTLDVQTFPGPPNYYSIKAGDDIETHFYLKMDLSVDVLPTGEHPGVSEPLEERNVRSMQLSIGPETDWAQFRKIGKGGRVKIKGTLFHRFTGFVHG